MTVERLTGVEPVPGVAKPDPLLEVNAMVRRFGGLVAVSVDHLEVQRGTITSLIGPNGAGKTTFFNLLTAFDQPDEGEWHLEGGALVGIPSFRVARKGMVRTFQLTKALSRMTVLENLMLGGAGQAGERLSLALLAPAWRREFDNVDVASFLILYAVQTETLLTVDKADVVQLLVVLKVFQQLTLQSLRKLPTWLALAELAYAAVQAVVMRSWFGVQRDGCSNATATTTTTTTPALT